MNAITQGNAAGLSYLDRVGDGMPIVLLHGIGSYARSFEPLMAAFDARHRVVAWDAPGYGDSNPVAVDWPDASDYAVVLNRLLVQLDISRCILVGHSLGALIAARFALVSPNHVTALCLVSPALGYGVDKGEALPPAVARRIEELDCLGPREFARARAAGLLADPAARPDVLASVERAMTAIRRPGYDRAARLLAGGRLLDDAARISVPTAVIVGSQDRITPPANAHRLFDALRSSGRNRFSEIPDAGHAVCQERPVEVARAIASSVDNKAAVHAG